jgi:hypothetical protein
LATILDQGSDIKRGANQFRQNHPKVKLLHDISHKLSLVMEYELKDDPQWSDYIKLITLTRKRVYQTELAAIMPQRQREKARFMDIGHLVEWPDRIHKSKRNGLLSIIAEERCQDYLGWINGFTEQLEEWKIMVGTVNMFKNTVREFGISQDVYLYLKIYLEEPAIEGDRLRNFILNVLGTVKEEVDKLDEGQTLICSTEVLESGFGKYKLINEGSQGITGSIVGMAAFVGKEPNINDIKEVMESCSVKAALEWIRQRFGKTIASLRKRFCSNKKGTNFDSRQDMAFSN